MKEKFKNFSDVRAEILLVGELYQNLGIRWFTLSDLVLNLFTRVYGLGNSETLEVTNQKISYVTSKGLQMVLIWNWEDGQEIFSLDVNGSLAHLPELGITDSK